jgi:hypothetical protein
MLSFGTSFSLVVYVLTGWLRWFVFLPFLLFDFRKRPQRKKIAKDTEYAFINTYKVKSLLIIDLEKLKWFQMKPHKLLFKM